MFDELFYYFCCKYIEIPTKMEESKDINRIKVVLAEKKRTNK